MNLTAGLPVARMTSIVIWYGLSWAMRSFHMSLGSPIDSQTSV